MAVTDSTVVFISGVGKGTRAPLDLSVSNPFAKSTAN